MASKIDFSSIMEKSINEAFAQAREITPKEKSKIAKWDKRKSGRLIRKAAEILTDKGRAIGSLEDSSGALCLRGAVNYAWCGNARVTYQYFVFRGEKNPEPILAIRDFGDFLAENKLVNATAETKLLPISVESWNDKNKDTDEVIRWMHKFADEVDPQR